MSKYTETLITLLDLNRASNSNQDACLTFNKKTDGRSICEGIYCGKCIFNSRKEAWSARIIIEINHE